MACVGPSAAFKNLLQALREQYEQDVAYARKQGALDAGKEPTPVDATNSVEAASGLQTPGPEATIPGVPDLSPRCVRPADDSVSLTPVVPLHTPFSEHDHSVASPRVSPVQAGTSGPHNGKPKQPDKQIHRSKSSAASDVDAQVNLPPLERFVNSSLFDKISGALLVSNAFFIAIQVEFMFHDSSPAWIDAVDFIYCILFIIELAIRLLGFGCRAFWCDRANMWWNIFDFVVVFLSTLDTVVSFALSGQNTPLASITVLRVVRIVRIVRVLRIIRVLKFFQDLRILIASIVSTLKTATFAFALIFMIIFMFGIGITQLVAEHVETKRVEGNPVDPRGDMMFFFGSVPKTIFSLFMTIAGGIDWKDAAVPLIQVGPIAFFFYMSFVVLMILCVMNVLTGIFCQSAIETAQNDRENVMRMQLQEKKEYVQTLKALFFSWDESADGKCTKHEFEAHLDDHDTASLLRTLEIEARDALALFELLDEEGKGEIDLDQFVTGCITLRGGAKAVHMEKVAAMNAQLVDSMDAIDKKMQLILEQSPPQQKPQTPAARATLA